MKKTTPFFLLWIISINLLAQQNLPFVVSENRIDSDLSGYLFTTKNLKFREEKKLILQRNQFKKVEERVANFGSSSDENWLMFDLKNASSQNTAFVLYLNQVFLKKADFYLFKNDTLIQKYLLSDTLKAINRPLSEINFYYPFQAQQNQNYCIFLRIKANPENGIAKGIVNLYDTKTAAKKTRNSHLEFGLLMGFLVLSITIGFILFYNDPKPIYGYYAAYILSVLFSYLCAYGYLHDFLDENHVHFAKIYQSVMIISAVLHVVFINHFLAFDKLMTAKNAKTINFICIAYILLAISNFIFPIAKIIPYISRITLILLGVFILITSVWAFYRKEQTAKIYLIASSPGIIALLYLLLIALKLLPIYTFIYSLLFYITIFEILVFGFGLVYQFTEEKHEVERKLSEERQLIAKKIITAQEQERQRIAQDLHDDLGSTLSMLKNKLSENYEDTLEMQIADKAVNDLRHISHNLMPTTFLLKGLKEAIQELVFLNKKMVKIDIDFICSGIEKKLGWEVELSIFRIVKELVNNAIKHAKPTKIVVQMLYFEAFLYISVEDDGIGMTNFNAEFSSGIGIKNIILRVNYLNGKMNQESSENGTLISIEIPYEPNTKSQNPAD